MEQGWLGWRGLIWPNQPTSEPNQPTSEPNQPTQSQIIRASFKMLCNFTVSLRQGVVLKMKYLQFPSGQLWTVAITPGTLFSRPVEHLVLRTFQTQLTQFDTLIESITIPFLLCHCLTSQISKSIFAKLKQNRMLFVFVNFLEIVEYAEYGN